MAHGTIRRNIQIHVFWVGGLVKIGRVAGRALRRRARVPIRMALYTIRRKVCPGQRKIGGIMVKTTASISCWVTGKAGSTVVNISPDPVVLIVRFRVDMATRTSEFGVV